MKERGKHFHYRDRLRIEYLYNEKVKGTKKITYRDIAKAVNCAVSSVYAEIKKGLFTHLNMNLTTSLFYSADVAQNYADNEATAKGAPLKLGHNYTYANYIAEQIKGGFSPDAIAGRLKREGKWTVCTNTLYTYIENGYLPDISNKNLLRKSQQKKAKTPKRPARRPAGTSIEDRPKEILNRDTFGHWEIDSVIGKAQGAGESLLTLTERKSRYEILLHVENKTAKATVQALWKIITRFKQGTFQTITCDNGSEFADALGMEHDKDGNRQTVCYYCHPSCPSERGSNENANSIVRRFFPKGRSLSSVTTAQVQAVETWMNDLPRRALGYATAKEVFDAWQAMLLS